MSKDIETMINEAPVLTLDPFSTTELPVEGAHAVPAEVEEENLAESIPEAELTPEERKMIDDFAARIDLTDSNLVLQYGAGAQKKIADFSEAALDNVKTKDLGEIGEMLSSVVTELRSFEAEEEDKGFFGFFKKSSNKLESMKAKYNKAEVNVNQICKILENHQIQLLKDIALLDKMYDLNTTYFKELSMYILAGKKKLNEVRGTMLPALMDKAHKTGGCTGSQ